MPAIEPNVLVWARETAGLSLDDAAEKIGMQGEAAAERLRAIELGEREPSRAQLLKMSKAYRRSLLTLYLPAPPAKGDRGQDFRTLPQQQTPNEPLVDALVRDIRTRQSMVRSVLEDDPDVQPLRFVGSMTMNNGVAAVAHSIQQTLDFDVRGFRAEDNADEAFAYLRSKAETAGVFVLLIGNLGSHHTDLEVAAFRGFALADSLAPFVVINDHDARSAWSFTLLHELAHLWLGATGISGSYGEGRLERFCNDVASSLLLRGEELQALEIDQGTAEREAARLIGTFAEDRRVSRSMVAYRLFLIGRISEQTWRNLSAGFHQEWLASRDAQRQRAQQREGGPNYYVVRRHRLGRGLLRFVERSIQDGALTPTKASLVLGVKARSVAPLLGTIPQEAV
jgi:Zn-dependent peptidase ImmA (M78 family)/transcriptional regulator with XRE-family HTH domain